jgi:hypothetical protein
MDRRGSRVHDHDILDALEEAGTSAFDGEVWRVVIAGRDPTRGSTANGRWSSNGEFEVLYTSLEKNGAIAEIGHRLSLEPVWPSRIAHQVHKLAVTAARVARLQDLETLTRLKVDVSRYNGYDYTATQAIAAAADFLGHDALMVPNARHPSANLVLLLGNSEPDSVLKVISSEPVDWTAWRLRPKS